MTTSLDTPAVPRPEAQWGRLGHLASFGLLWGGVASLSEAVCVPRAIVSRLITKVRMNALPIFWPRADLDCWRANCRDRKQKKKPERTY